MQNNRYATAVERVTQTDSAPQEEPIFLYMTNELRSTLGPLRRSVDFMLERAQAMGNDPGLVELLKGLQRQAQRADTMVERQEAFAWLRQPGTPITLRPTDLCVLATEVAADFTLAHPELSIAVETPYPVVIQADPLHFGQVLVNLLTHAVRNSPEGGTVGVRLWIDSERAYCAVTDDGPTMEYEDDLASRVLRRLHEGSARGARVGLAISTMIVRRYGGLLLHSGGKAGHEFRFWVPVR